MSTISGLWESLVSVLHTDTGTGLDVLGYKSHVPEVAEFLFFHDLIPASRTDIRFACEQVAGSALGDDEMLEIQSFLLSFGWLK